MLTLLWPKFPENESLSQRFRVLALRLGLVASLPLFFALITAPVVLQTFGLVIAKIVSMEIWLTQHGVFASFAFAVGTFASLTSLRNTAAINAYVDQQVRCEVPLTEADMDSVFAALDANYYAERLVPVFFISLVAGGLLLFPYKIFVGQEPSTWGTFGPVVLSVIPLFPCFNSLLFNWFCPSTMSISDVKSKLIAESISVQTADFLNSGSILTKRCVVSGLYLAQCYGRTDEFLKLYGLTPTKKTSP
jgi:hypothetical protein